MPNGNSRPKVVAVLADTHLPRGDRRLPDACVERIEAADELIHAGDFLTPEVLTGLRGHCPTVHAVHGNVDRPALRRSLPETLEVEIEGARVGLIHDAGRADGRLARLRARFPACDAVVFGHSHMPLHEELDGFQIFNPGSPTERRRSPRRSMGMLTVSGSKLSFSHLWL
jgi:uncharacterized protein